MERILSKIAKIATSPSNNERVYFRDPEYILPEILSVSVYSGVQNKRAARSLGKIPDFMFIRHYITLSKKRCR